jgi:CSLREA domain-containing protein/uncharacterized repeat protein (TIGR01451 family)
VTLSIVEGHRSATTGDPPSACSRETSGRPVTWIAAAIVFCAVFSGTPAHAAVFNVNSNLDIVDDNPGDGSCATAGGDCTLRAAIQEANALAGADTINVSPSTYTLTIAGDGEDAAATGDLDVTEDLVINGSDAGTTVVDGNALDRVFENYASLLTISRLMIRNGLVNADGGGIRVHGSNSLTLNKVTISDNDVFDKKGGAIVLSSGTLTMTNVTLSGNSAKEGGALANSSGTVIMTNVTIAGNTATSKGAGVVPGSGSFTVANTIIANNDAVPDCDSSIGPGTNNLDGDGSCGFATTADPLLGPLQDNGGSSHTHALPIGSPAIDTGDNAVCVAPDNNTDQRNQSRPYDGDGDTVATCDIGAFESEQAPVQISGAVSEDVNGDANLGDAVGRPSVAVSLYLDDGDDVPDAGDTLFLSTTTDASGAYSLSPVGAGTFWVVVDSQTLTPSAGLNAPFTADHSWAQQTYGPAGGWCADGAGGTTERGSAGPCYAGRLATTADDASALTTAEHIARVTVAGADVINVDFAFSYNAVTNTSADVQAAVNARSTQGSFDQVLANANAVAGENTIRFVPVLAPDDGSGAWWRIDYTAAAAALESIYDATTVVDGTAYCAWDDGTQGCAAVTTVRNTNAAAIGAAQTVGVNGTFTTPSLDPELEIVSEGLRISQTVAPLVPNGVEIRHLSVWGDTIPVHVEAGAASLTGILVDFNVLGSPPGAFAEPPVLPEWGVRIDAATSCEINDNLIGFAQRSTVLLATTSTGCRVSSNEIRESGKVFNTFDGVLLWAGPSDVQGNLIIGHEALGIDTISSGGGHRIRENTVDGNGLGGVQTGGVRLVGGDNVAMLNIIQNNTGPGVIVNGGATVSVQNRISQNHFSGNSGTAIDLVASGGSNDTGDGINTNDGTFLGDGSAGNVCGTLATSGNLGLDFPIIDDADGLGNVTGRACPNATVEVYIASAGAGDMLAGRDHGEGIQYLGATMADAAGDFSLNVGALSPGDALSAIDIDGANNTSEFGPNFLLGYEVAGTVYDDINDNGSLDASELGIGTGWAKLISGGTVIRVVEADPDSGAYSFSNIADGSYTVIVDDNDNVADTTPTEPLNWLFRNPVTGSLAVTVAGADETDHDFGFTYDFDLAADCVCDYQDGFFTQRVIAIDGDMTDWGPILSDPDNNACDAADNTDRDHPIQSTGRNLLRTAVTWDATYFSMWTQRVGSSSNTQNFIYYADTNVDGIMSAGEPVVVAKWQGSNGNVTLELYGYDDLGSGGDPLLDGSGYVDGYNMPGDLTLVKTLNPPDGDGQGATAGSIAGTQMEWHIEWSELGVPAGAAISWHVSSTNANPGASGLGTQVDDNLGGCGAQCAGSNQFAGVAADPISGGGGQIVYSSSVFTNTGNGPDLFDFEWSSTGAWVPVSVIFYRDLGTIGQFDPGVDTIITDTDGDTLPDTGNLLAGESFDLLVGIELPGPPATGSATVTITGTSNFVPGCGATVTPAKGSVNEALYIPGVELSTAKDDGVTEARVGLSVSYTITLTNTGPDDSVDATVSDTFDPAVFDVPNVSWSCAITTAGSGTDACDDPGPTNGDINTTVDLSNGAEATFTVDAPILLSASGTIDNTATATAVNETDTDTANNSGQDNDTVLLDMLQIVKRAFQLDGTAIPNGIDMPNGVPFRFLLYINNDGPAVTDASLQDMLDPGFAYVPGSLSFGTVAACAAPACTAAEEDAIFAAADTGTVGSDAVDPDVVSFAGATIDAGDQNVGNAQLDVPADTVWALVFTARLQ